MGNACSPSVQHLMFFLRPSERKPKSKGVPVLT